MRAQVTTELMIIIASILLIFIPVIVTVYFKTVEANNNLEVSQAQLAVSRLASLINSIGNLGENSYIKTEIFIPRSVKQIKFSSFVNGGEVIFTVIDANGRESEFVEVVKYRFSDTTLENPPPGITTFLINSKGTTVEVKRV